MDGILQVSAEDKGTGKAEKITITAEKGRLNEDQIKRMIREAEEFAEEDKKVKQCIDSKNGLESYLYSLKNTLEDDNMGVNMKFENKKELLEYIDETLDWLEDNTESDVEEYDEKRNEVEQIVNPIMRKVYANDASDYDEEDDFGDDE